MSRLVRRLAAAGLLVTSAHALRGQSAAEYRARVDSLATMWRSLAAVEAKMTSDTTRPSSLPRDSIRVGPIIVRADSQYVALGQAAAARLAPRVERAYGQLASQIAGHQFVIRSRNGLAPATSVATGVTDSTGIVQLRASVFANEEALESSWAQKVEEIVADELDPSIRRWLGTVIPMAQQDAAAWSRARIDLLLASTEGARQCVAGETKKCTGVLGLMPVEEPAFAFYTPLQRRELVVVNSRILRRSDPAQFDRCNDRRSQPACDSLARMIPSDVIPLPVPPSVRQSLLRYALEIGGEGAFDRLANGSTIAGRIEAAARMPADSVVMKWRVRLLDARTSSTALDVTTTLSSLFWIGVCACLALRSSRWR